ncbi:Uncharacterised protein [Mycobacteroides abscessus subsp. abscessus]|nr:Uncharacterised protein [Mycobacteroides abscessus subsp. abscessus]
MHTVVGRVAERDRLGLLEDRASICRSFIHSVSAWFRTGAPKYSPRKIRCGPSTLAGTTTATARVSVPSRWTCRPNTGGVIAVTATRR